MADPANVTLTQLRDAFALIGIQLDDDFVRLELREDLLTIYRVVRTGSGMPRCLPDGGAQTQGSTVNVVAALPPAPEG
ncbi:hypothetical protein JMF97_04045 [Micromonospora fiedleri]|uniref:Uncharacterized protein n=1 Tax=Micromonospora fiedleri TaxID=1157498 RepID=A0ABS1UJ02_9ACTN|nr:hypothetical protein [Micromonospora fiedleri]MBL6275331.1 hypothetical protein [Micromonospora fiedleri]